ncbi:uncharacterized protein LOC130097711 [Rhinichthys klamathensis goyatoka]|uniref:uncharacterized protein LOC130097711 n=1 Tax=Rhinichthys klamathensis goyatoka TaxID=3034132 RepID=UPI0024B59E2F|nr:uncharacterized protein LOC130097711 [Rhinichthys klamathensis goyatoka]
MFALRLCFHLHNQRINNNFLQDIQKMSQKDVHLGLHGHLLIGVDEETDKEMYQRTSAKSLTDPQAVPDKVEEDMESFTVSLFPISEQNKDKLKQLYISWRRERQIIHRFSAYATLYIADLRSVCPSSLLEEDPNKNMPWLNDNAVNCRLAQIAAETQNVVALYTEVYILLYREWTKNKAISRSHVEDLEDFPTAIGEREEGEIETNTCMAQDIKACVYQNTGNKTLHPHIKRMKWVQCDLCNKWLHTDCAGIDPTTIRKDTPFSCGCDQQPYSFQSTLTALKQGLLVDTVVEDEEIVKLHHDLTSGAVRSHTMFLHKHSSYAPKLKNQCNLRISVFDQEQTEGIIDKVYSVLALEKTDLSSPSYAMEVMTPEITILILRKTEGIHRFQAEMAFATCNSF